MAHRLGGNGVRQGPSLGGRRDQRWLLYLSAVVAITGVQLVVPALPSLQRELGLSDVELSMVTSAYLLPSVPAAFISGILAERFGRRVVYAGSLLLFGVAGILVPILGGWSFALLLVLRMLQGTGFAAVLPMTITIIGDLFRGTEQVRVQGHRSVAMHIGDAGLPLLGGLLASVSWQLPFFAPGSGIILAAMVWWRFPTTVHGDGQANVPAAMRLIPQFLRDLALVSLQFAGFMRFLVRFAVLSYLPLLAVSEKGLSTFVASSALALAAAAGGVGALTASRLAGVVRFSWLLVIVLCTLATALLGIGASGGSVSLMVSAVGYGTADGLFGVLLNSMVAEAVGGRSRATFVSLTATIRNLGKFIAPVVTAGIAVVAPLSLSFTVIGLLALLTLAVVPMLVRLNALSSHEEESDVIRHAW